MLGLRQTMSVNGPQGSYRTTTSQWGASCRHFTCKLRSSYCQLASIRYFIQVNYRLICRPLTCKLHASYEFFWSWIIPLALKGNVHVSRSNSLSYMRKSTNKFQSTHRTFTVDCKSPVCKLFRQLLSPIIQHNSLWIILTLEDKLKSVTIRWWRDLDRRSPTWSRIGNLVAGFMISDEFGNRFFPTAATDYWQSPAGIACQRVVFSEAFCRLCYVLRSGINNQELNWVHVNFRKLDILPLELHIISLIGRWRHQHGRHRGESAEHLIWF